MFTIRIVIIFNIFLLFGKCAVKVNHKVLSIKDCELPEKRYDLENLVPHTWSMSEDKKCDQDIKINFVIKKKTPSLTFRIRVYKQTESDKRLDFAIERLNCEHPFIAVLFNTLKVNYNAKACQVFPGNYTIERFNLDRLGTAYKFYNIFSLGMYLIEMEYSTSKGVLLCAAITIRLWKS